VRGLVFICCVMPDKQIEILSVVGGRSRPRTASGHLKRLFEAVGEHVFRSVLGLSNLSDKFNFWGLSARSRGRESR
jgi:hypothetical protein